MHLVKVQRHAAKVKSGGRGGEGREGGGGQIAAPKSEQWESRVLRSLRTISGLSFICIKIYLHSTVNGMKSCCTARGECERRRGRGIQSQKFEQWKI